MINNRIGINPEDFTKRMNAMKVALELKINELQNLRRLLKQYDGKMFNKNLPEAINKGGKYIAYISKSSYSNRKSFRVSLKNYRLPELVQGWYINQDLFDEYADIEGKEIELNRRFNFAGFDTFCKEKIQKYRQYLAQVEKDLLDGLQRLQEAEQVARYYQQLVKGFSEFAQSHYDRSFQQTYFRN
jgi:hypothetical protein